MKYCGGCRANYDRKAEAALTETAVRKALAGLGGKVSFRAARQGVSYDALLVVCGCPSRCADISPYDAGGRIVYIDHAGGSMEAADGLVLIARRELA